MGEKIIPFNVHGIFQFIAGAILNKLEHPQDSLPLPKQTQTFMRKHQADLKKLKEGNFDNLSFYKMLLKPGGGGFLGGGLLRAFFKLALKQLNQSKPKVRKTRKTQVKKTRKTNNNSNIHKINEKNITMRRKKNVSTLHSTPKSLNQSLHSTPKRYINGRHSVSPIQNLSTFSTPVMAQNGSFHSISSMSTPSTRFSPITSFLTPRIAKFTPLRTV